MNTSNNNNIRVRFAPSPTGFLHIGSLRTVLFTYLIAKHYNGKFILRIEDTDQKREVEGAVDSLVDILNWAGLTFDEGPHVGGEFGPYIQSQRQPLYDKYKNELLEKGEAYCCFCSAERLDKMRADQQEKKLPPRYDRCCRELSQEEVKSRIEAGQPHVVRQKMPLTGDVVVHDEIRGDIKFRAEDLDDQVLIKSNGVPTYQFASVVDDYLMKISHVTRADEWLSSFPKNALLYQAFGWEMPKFIHYSVILNKEGGGKLSKRQGDVAVEDFRDKGYLQESLINFCSLLGWHPKDDVEILSLTEIITKFDANDISASPAVFDIEKLDYFNGYYIRQKDIKSLTKLCLPFLESAGFVKNQDLDTLNYIEKIVSLEQERMKKLSDISNVVDYFFDDELNYDVNMLAWKKMSISDAKDNLTNLKEVLELLIDWNKTNLESTVMNHIKASELKVGEVLWPMRACLTGRQASPGPFEVAEVLGKEKTIKRIDDAINKIDILLRGI